MLPYQWSVLHDEADISIDKEREDEGIPSEKSNAIENLKIAAGQSKGSHYGWLFQDSDVYKWLESAANAYAIHPEEQLNIMMDSVITLIEDAQDENGYLSTYYQIEAPQLKFRRLFESHELYNAGHLIEAAVAHYKATGDKRLIKVSEKLVNCIKQTFGPEEGKIKGADGHQEIELALVRLYEVTGKRDYLDMSEWFLEIRGKDPDFYQKQLIENKRLGIDSKMISINTIYHQAYKPVTDQEDAVGHAVRLVYMAAAMAEIAFYNDNEKMLKAARRIWENIVTKKIYITGGIGSTVNGEAFTFDYDLPNDTMYCETCASIGLMFFARSMMKNGVNAEYADIIERALYNSVISGMALDGKHFFYVNPLEVDPKASSLDPGKSHVKATRPSWFGCACCPPNIARTLTSLGQYVATTSEDNLYVHLYMDMEGTYELSSQAIYIKQKTDMPYQGNVKLFVGDITQPVSLYLRVPSWAGQISLNVNGQDQPFKEKEGYVELNLVDDAVISLTIEMPILEWNAHPMVKNNRGKVAVQRGPFVYCAEEVDNTEHLHLYTLVNKPVSMKKSDGKLGEFVALVGEAEKEKINETWINQLYQSSKIKDDRLMTNLTLIPYHLWANRSVGEMLVWIDRKEK